MRKTVPGTGHFASGTNVVTFLQLLNMEPISHTSGILLPQKFEQSIIFLK